MRKCVVLANFCVTVDSLDIHDDELFLRNGWLTKGT